MLMLGAKRAALASPAVWTPRRNWPDASSPGFWLDPTVFAGVFQDSAGTSPATAVEQPAGLAPDKRPGLVLGPELVASGTFDANVSGWSIGPILGTPSWGGGEMLVTVGAPNGRAKTTLSGMVVGNTYKLTASMRVVTPSGSSKAWIGASPSGLGVSQYLETANTSNTTLSRTIIADATTMTLVAGDNSNTSGAVFAFDSISVRELPGNHFSQTTSTSRPIIRVTGGVQSLAFDGLDDSLSTGPITLGADMDCFIAIRRNSSAAIAIFGLTDRAAGTAQINGTGLAYYSAGTPSFAINGVAVPGGTATTTGQFHTAFVVGQWCIVEMRNLNLSTWSRFAISDLADARANASIAEVFACPAGSEATRAKNRKWLGAKVGLSLP